MTLEQVYWKTEEVVCMASIKKLHARLFLGLQEI